MHYLSVENLGKSFGISQLFSQLSFHINEGDKIALVAKNGSGKTTLLKILAGKETAEEGNVITNKEVRVALFEQDPKFDEQRTILENIFQREHPVIQAIKIYEQACDSENHELLSDAIIRMDELQAWNFDAKVKQILGKLNIHHLEQTMTTLSGGQRKRVALAQTLIDIGFEHQHVLLIMDEPTNHLDVEMVEWLEHYLNQEKVTLLLVTHDRYFLDEVCREIWELDENKLYIYKGDYENFLEKKAARIESQSATIDKAKNQYRKELEWMRKQPKARTTKSKSREDNFFEIEKKAKQKITDQSVSLNMKMNRLGGKVAELKKLYKSFGEKSILKGFDYNFSRGERIGIIGKNGTGKSTFLNILLGIETPDSGKINIGDTVVFGNFSQSGLQFKEDVRVIEYVKNIAEHFPLADGGTLSAAQFLELFLFSPQSQYTFLSQLSGGEKKRLQLLAVLFKNPNFLILDEPTNDLDLATLSVLENFLMDYQGCLLIVSHDRYFMDKIVDHLFVFEGGGIVTDFPGNYTQYRIHSKEKERNLNTIAMPAAKTEVLQKSGKQRKLTFNEKREFEAIENEIPLLENEKVMLTAKMSAEQVSYEAMEQMSQRIKEITTQIEDREMRWLELSEII